MTENVTAVIKTFERPAFLRRLLATLRAFYPDMPVLVADDSRKPAQLDMPGVRVLAMPYDSGLSAGRNLLVSKVQTSLFLLLDDDFIFTDKTDVRAMERMLRRNPDIDILGGGVRDRVSGFWKFEGLLEQTECRHAIKRDHWLETRPGCVICEIIPNFFLARTERVALVGWDASLKLSEHVDFFARCRGTLRVGFMKSVWIDHDRRGAPAGYAQMRGRSGLFYKAYQAKHGFKSAKAAASVPKPRTVHPVAAGRR